MSERLRLAAVDLGAESGRVVLGCFDGERADLEVVHRFANRPVWLPDGLHWNLPTLFCEALAGLRAAASTGPLDGIGIDAWGCDYALLDGGERILGLPFHYRDGRVSGDVLARAHARVGREELYRRTGIQTMAINTVYQLSAEAGGPAASVAERIALVPDLMGLWLTGTLVNELTVASTTGLLEAHGRRWASDLVRRLGLPERPFAGTVVEPAVEVGLVLEQHAEAAGAATGSPVRTVGGHDTASAFAAAPISGRHCAVLSSGTWSLLGLELDQPELGPEASVSNLTNERGVCGTVRLLRNIMGLWLVQECRRAWLARGVKRDYDELQQLAAAARPDVPVFDPDDDSLLHPAGNMPARISALCAAGGQPAPDGDGELMRAILVSLACKYRLVLEQLEDVTGCRIDTVHVVGGGANNVLLCQLAADLLQREVLAGPVEATALGNALVQALAAGELSDLGQLRRVVAQSVELRRHEPGPAAAARETYHRFLMATGRLVHRPAPAPV
ncbi:MAG TPA: rhamnulokinase family protein [Solirubrobacteraceae bacterium]|jgi:rhamnulokinase|nr:rhamnulokinase family protein [Solirubrobacteraceae bacterium]